MRSSHGGASKASWIAPRLALTSCVRAYLTRSTLDCAPLPPAQRFNRFPAHAYCSITWFLHGAPRLLGRATDPCAGDVLPAEMFGGPQSRPVEVAHAGRMAAFTIAFYPDALQALTGLAVSVLADRFVPLATVLDGGWQSLSREVLQAPDDAHRIAAIERFLEPRWQALRASGKIATTTAAGDWVRSLAGRAIAAGGGLRNVERRIRSWAGQSHRRMRRLNRLEQAFLDIRARHQNGTLSGVDIALRHGYADQAHLCRDLREMTGYSLTELTSKTDIDESFWAYRIWS